MFVQNVPANNHGSAAAVSPAAALPPMAAGSLNLAQLPPVVDGNQAAPSFMQPPPAAVMKPAAATESLGTMGTEYPPPNHGRPRRTTMSADSRVSDLGAENRDARSRSPFSSEDTLVFSPELAGARQPAKREARTRTSSAKKRYMPMASSPPAKLVLRRPSSSPGGPRRQGTWPSPRNRAQQPIEERLAIGE